MKIEPANDAAAVEDIITIYRLAFGGAPWNEGWRCSRCEKALPLDPNPEKCPACGGETMTEYWPREKVRTDFMSEMKRPEAECFVATVKQKIIGFAWGYALPRVETEADAGEIETLLDAPGFCHFPVGDLLRGEYGFYIDDVAVHPKYQRDGIGKQLVKAICAEQRYFCANLRTLANSQMRTLAENLGGVVVQEISRGRVIMRIYTGHRARKSSV